MVNFIAVAIAAAAIGVAGYFIFYRKKSAAASTTSGSVQPSGWSITNSRNMPEQMAQNSDGYFFDFPSSDGVHYVVEPAPKLQLGQTVTLTFNVSGSGSVVPVQGNPPAKVSLFMQRKGDNLSGTGAYQQYRYWHSSADLVGGDGVLACTLTVDQWTDVFGERGTLHESQFAECVINAEMIGMTFGDPSAGANGHGAYVINGSARFTLKNFTIQ